MEPNLASDVAQKATERSAVPARKVTGWKIVAAETVIITLHYTTTTKDENKRRPKRYQLRGDT